MCMTYVISTGRMNVFLYSDVMCSGIEKSFSSSGEESFQIKVEMEMARARFFKDSHRNRISRNQAFDLLDTRWMSRNPAFWNGVVMCCETWNTSHSWVKCLMTNLRKFEFDLVQGSFQWRVWIKAQKLKKCNRVEGVRGKIQSGQRCQKPEFMTPSWEKA